MYCGTLTAAYNLLYENFTYIGEVLLVKEDNTEGNHKMPVETKCEIVHNLLWMKVIVQSHK